MGIEFRAAFITAAFIIAQTSTACAEDWIPTAAITGGSAFYTDLSTISRRGDVVQSWMREDLRQSQPDPQNRIPYGHVITQRYDDCVARKFSFGGSVRRNDKGEVVNTFSNEGGWQDMVPGSVAEGIWRVACAATEPPKEKPLLPDIGSGTWSRLGPSADNKYVMYAALDRVVRLDAQHALVLSRQDFERPEIIYDLPIRYLLSATILDCPNRKIASLGVDLFLSAAIRVRSERSTDLNYQSPAPGTFAFRYIDQFCAAATPIQASTTQDPEQAAVFSGTAWLVTKGYLVTADHVITGAKSLTLYSNGVRVGGAEIVAEDAANDLAVLKPVGWSPRNLSALPIAAHGATLGKSVFTLGYPEPGTLGQHIKMTAGDVSGTSGPHDDVHDLQISVPIQPGNSGGPLIAWDGAVVGVVDSKLMGFNGQEQDEPKPELVNYAVKSAYLRPMLDDLPELASYKRVDAKGGPDQVVAEARKSVFMVIAAH